MIYTSFALSYIQHICSRQRCKLVVKNTVILMNRVENIYQFHRLPKCSKVICCRCRKDPYLPNGLVYMYMNELQECQDGPKSIISSIDNFVACLYQEKMKLQGVNTVNQTACQQKTL